MTKAVKQNPDQVGTWVKSTTHLRFGPVAVKSRRSRPVGARSPSAGPVARGFLPGAAPDSPSARMRRSTVHRAT